MRKHPPRRIACCLRFAQLATDLLDQFLQGGTAECSHLPCTLKDSFIELQFDRLHRPPYPWHASASSNALVSCRSAVSKPSVNQL
jgi:hypothetical protein